MQKWKKKIVPSVLSTSLLMATYSTEVSQATTTDCYTNPGRPSCELTVPTYEWKSATFTPTAIVVAVHGLTLHGNTYESLAHVLMSRHVMTVAQDLRGFGRCYMDAGCDSGLQRLNYNKSKEDLVSLLEKERSLHPGVPIYCLGESLGANLAIWLTAAHPELIDGLILSGPCIKRYWHITPRMIVDFGIGLARPQRQIRLRQYVDPYLANDPEVIRAYDADPLVRKTLSLSELVRSLVTITSSLKYGRKISCTMPALIVEGTEDHLCRSDAVRRFVAAQMRSDDRRIYWVEGQGHLLVETTAIRSDVTNVIADWICEHAQNRNLIAPREEYVKQVSIGK